MSVFLPRVRPRIIHSTQSPRLVANGLGLLVLVVSVLGLELFDERDVLLLGLVRGDALVDLLLPCVLLCLALYAGGKKMMSAGVNDLGWAELQLVRRSCDQQGGK